MKSANIKGICKYIVKADMPAGYVRIYDKQNKCYILKSKKGAVKNEYLFG